jgi:hypothetical protein
LLLVCCLSEQFIAIQQVCLSDNAQFICDRWWAFTHWDSTHHLRQPGGYCHWPVKCTFWSFHCSAFPIICTFPWRILTLVTFLILMTLPMIRRMGFGHWC